MMNRPETDFLLRCARRFAGSTAGAPLPQSAFRDLDWDLVERLAVRHRILPLVYRTMAADGGASAPKSVLERFRSVYLANAASNLRATSVLAKLMSDFEAAGIRAAAYKGPALAVAAYGDLGLRMFNDLDIFVDERNLKHVLELLYQKGFVREDGSREDVPPLKRRLLRDIVLRDFRQGAAVEIQWRLTQRYHPVLVKAEALWRRTIRVNLEGVSIRTFSRDDALLLLCLHGLYHGWSQLQMVVDVDQSLRRGGIEARRILEIAEQNRAVRILFLGLLLAREMLDAPLPANLWDAALSDKGACSLARETGRRFFEEERVRLRARRFFFRESALLPGIVPKVRYFVGRLLTPNEEDFGGRPKNGLAFCLLPGRRLVRLFRSYALQDGDPKPREEIL